MDELNIDEPIIKLIEKVKQIGLANFVVRMRSTAPGRQLQHTHGCCPGTAPPTLWYAVEH